MSTLSGSASKGEKSKPKFQVLDINSLYRHSRGENTEKTTQKSSSINIRYGMQCLGKVPSARRAPANLPSLKSEHSGSDAAVPLVPPGAPPGWGKQESNITGPTTPTAAPSATAPATSVTPAIPTPNQSSQNQQPQVVPQLTPHQAAIALPVSPNAPIPPGKQLSSAQIANGNEKLWSTVMSGHPNSVDGQPPLYHSTQFQHEFPSLSAGDGAPQRVAAPPDAHYASGLSLRPQTEGTWSQGGGQRAALNAPIPPGGVEQRPGGSVQSGGPPQLSAQVGREQPPAVFPPQMRGVMPSFMYKGSSFAPQGTPTGPNHNMVNMPPQTAPANMNSGRRPMDNRQPPARLSDKDANDVDLVHRPILKAEDLNKLDDIGQDMGWALDSDVDYNERLGFSDEESDSRTHKKDSKMRDMRQAPPRQHQQQQWSRSGRGGRNSQDEEEMFRRRQPPQQNKEVDLYLQRAKQRKDEEEKRYEEDKARAAKKFSQMNEKNNKSPSSNSNSDVPLLPDYQKEKDVVSHLKEESTFRQLTQIESKTFPIKKPMQTQQQKQEQQQGTQQQGHQNGPSFSRQFQSDMPPRFLRQQRNNPQSNSTSSTTSGVSINYHNHQYDSNSNRWTMSQKNRTVTPDRDDDNSSYKRQSSEESFRSQETGPKQPQRYDVVVEEQQHHYYSSQQHRNVEKNDNRKYSNSSGDERRSSTQRDEKPIPNTEIERPQRSESRDSYSRRSRDSEPRDYMGSWSDTNETQCYEEKRREERRQIPAMVPGPITKDRIEADDSESSRNLTQLKRGNEIINKRLESKESKEHSTTWSDSMMLTAPEEEEEELEQEDIDKTQFPNPTITNEEVLEAKPHQEETNVNNSVITKKEDYRDNRHVTGPRSSNSSGSSHHHSNRGYSQSNNSNRSWGSNSSSQQRDYSNNSGWNKQRMPPGGGGRGGHKTSSSNREFFQHHHHHVGTDSDGSVDSKEAKMRKDDKNREIKHDSYVPRGEPSRHGRGGGGGGNFRGGNRMGISKRIDAYGPPAKSPFGHPEEHKEKKTEQENCHTTTSNVEPPPVDKVKQNQEALAAGLIGKNIRQEEDKPIKTYTQHRGPSSKPPDRRSKSRSKDDIHNESNSELSDSKDCSSTRKPTDNRSKSSGGTVVRQSNSGGPPQSRGGRPNAPPPPRMDKRQQQTHEHGKSDSIINKKSEQSSEKTTKVSTDEQHHHHNLQQHPDINSSDVEGFQEVKSKKNLVKDKPILSKSVDEKKAVPVSQQRTTTEKDNKEMIGRAVERKVSTSSNPASQTAHTFGGGTSSAAKPAVTTSAATVVHNIPSLMATPVNPPSTLPQSKPIVGGSSGPNSSNSYDRQNNRQNKLAPRFAKQRLQKAQMQQQQQHHQVGGHQGLVDDVNPVVSAASGGGADLNNKGFGGPGVVYGNVVKDLTSPVSNCAWDKPLGSGHQMRPAGGEHDLNVAMDGMKLEHQQHQQLQNANAGVDKMLAKSPQLQDKLDGTTPPVNTIIFENTNFKSAPGAAPRNTVSRNDKTPPQSRVGVDVMVDENGVLKPVIPQPIDLLQNNKPQQEITNKASDGIQLPALFKEDSSDMKLDFFGSDLTHLTDDNKSTSSKSLCMSAKSMHSSSSSSGAICNADSLNLKIASVKKVWDTTEQETEDGSGGVVAAAASNMTFVGGGLDHPGGVVFKSSDGQVEEVVGHHHHEGYSPGGSTGAGQQTSTTTNVCKVKPTQQVPGSATSQTVSSVAGQQQHSSMVPHVLLGTQLSPPPTIPPVLGANVGLGPQQYTASQHLGYQTAPGANTQYGMPAIPSPPTVLYNSPQQLQAAAAQSASLYGAFQLDQAGVLSNQRSQLSQYAAAAAAAASYHGLGQTASSPYSAQSVYLPTPPPHAPPPSAPAPPPELYPNMNNYRLSAAFGQNQQFNNPTTVLISSTSNSLMSASVKPSNQPISAIGTKAGGVGQAYQQQSQQSQQVYMTYDPTLQANYLSNAGVMQRGPAAQVQNNVVPTLQPSSSYYSGSTGGQTGYFQQPNNSTLQSAQIPQHQAGYGLQTNVFGTHNQSHTNTALQGYSSHFLSTALPVASAISAQFRSSLPNPYMKSVGSQQLSNDQAGGRQQEMLSSVFTSGPQIPSPKSRQNPKQHLPQPQSSPTSQRKYNLYQNMANQQQQNNIQVQQQQAQQQQRFPPPIQRPVNFQQNLGVMPQNNVVVNPKHRSNNGGNKPPNRQYYGAQANSLTNQNDKSDECKMNDTNNPNSSGKSAIGGPTSDTLGTNKDKDESAIVLKD